MKIRFFLPLLLAALLLAGCRSEEAGRPSGMPAEPSSPATSSDPAAQSAPPIPPPASPESTARGTWETAEDAYTTALSKPKTYAISGGRDEMAAAERLAAMFLDDQTEPNPARTFFLTEYRDLSVEVYPSSVVSQQPDTDWGLLPDSEWITGNTWLVYVSASFRFEGVYAPIGPPSDGLWYETLHQGSPCPLLLTETDGGYTLFSVAAQGQIRS